MVEEASKLECFVEELGEMEKNTQTPDYFLSSGEITRIYCSIYNSTMTNVNLVKQ